MSSEKMPSSWHEQRWWVWFPYVSLNGLLLYIFLISHSLSNSPYSTPLAVQNERQPRSTAQVRLDTLDIDTEKEHIATTREPTSSSSTCSVISRPLLGSSISSSINSSGPCQHSSSPKNSHRFMASLMTAETCAKLEPEDGRDTNQSWNSLHFLLFSKLLCCNVTIQLCSLFLSLQWTRILM